VSEGERRRPVGTDRATSRVRPVGWSDRWAKHGSERERWREEFLTRKLKTGIDKKKKTFPRKRTFLEKGFSI
jgi:hypothetical protein